MAAELSLRTNIKDDASNIDRLKTITGVKGEYSFSGDRNLKLANNRYDIFSTADKESSVDSIETERRGSNIFFHEGM